MMATVSPIFVSLLVAGVAYVLFIFSQWLATTRRPSGFPPGPAPTLGLGNVTEIPRDYPFLKYAEWAKEFGPITGLKIGPLNAIVLNEAPLVHEMLVKRAQHWSGRPSRYVAKNHVWPDSPYTHSVTMSWENSRKMRTGAKQYMVGAGLKELLPLHQAAAARLIDDLYRQEGKRKWEETVYHWAVRTPVAMLSGAETDELGDKWVEEYEASQHLYESILDPATAPPVDLFPVLRWVPAMFAEWKRKAPIARLALDKVYAAMFDHAKSRRHGSFPSLINKLLAHSSDPNTVSTDRLTEYEICLLVGGTLDAAAHSSAITFQIILFALLTHPEALQRARAEVDAVLGTGNSLPDHIDPESLPYLSACVIESLRWRPVSTFSLPRETTADQDVLGFRVPKGTMILQNIWHMHMDADYYDEPTRYKPERYLDNPLGGKPGAPHQSGRKNVYTFGIGRRECPGAAFFYQGMCLAYAQLLWAFDVAPDGPLGDPNDIKATFMHSLVLHPKPFGVKFTPRKENTDGILSTVKAKADKAFETMLG